MIFCFALFMDKKIIFERSNMKEFRLNKRLPGPAFPENLSLPADRVFPNCLSPIEFFQHASPDCPGHFPGRKFPPRSSPPEKRLFTRSKKTPSCLGIRTMFHRGSTLILYSFPSVAGRAAGSCEERFPPVHAVARLAPSRARWTLCGPVLVSSTRICRCA